MVGLSALRPSCHEAPLEEEPLALGSMVRDKMNMINELKTGDYDSRSAAALRSSIVEVYVPSFSRPTPRATEALSFPEQRLTGVIKNWKGGVPPGIVSKDNEHMNRRNGLIW